MMRCIKYAYDNETLKAIVQCMTFAPTNVVWHDVGLLIVPFDFILLLGLAIGLSSQKKKVCLPVSLYAESHRKPEFTLR